MHRIDTTGSVDGLFVAPNTIVDDAWLNAVQEETVGVILAAGIALAKGDHTQLLAAIKWLITHPTSWVAGDIGAAFPLGAVKAVPGYEVTPAGFVEQWWDAVADANGTTVIGIPIEFPNGIAWATVEGGTADPDAQDNNPTVTGRTTSTVSVYNARDGAVNVRLVAKGW